MRVSPRQETDDPVAAVPLKDREGIYGGLFGSTVHYAIGLVLRSSATNAGDAVHRAAKLYGLTEHLDEAAADVTRGLEALKVAGLARPPGADLQLEYPIAGLWNDGQLASGFIDLVAVEDGRVDVIDFKIDIPASGGVEQTYPKYAAQVRVYGKLLRLPVFRKIVAFVATYCSPRMARLAGYKRDVCVPVITTCHFYMEGSDLVITKNTGGSGTLFNPKHGHSEIPHSPSCAKNPEFCIAFKNVGSTISLGLMLFAAGY